MSHFAPLTHLFHFAIADNQLRPFFMAEFVANGEPNLVLTDALVRDLLRHPGFARTLRQDLASSGARFVDAHLPFGSHEDLNMPFGERRPVMLARQKLALQLVADFGVDSATVHVGNLLAEHAGFSLEQLRDCAVRSLDELLPVAQRLGITLAIENGWHPTCVPEALLAIVARFDCPQLGICYDSGHANLLARDRGAAESNPRMAWKDVGPVPYDVASLETLLPHVTTCHLHDNDGLTDQHRLPGRGDADWPHVLSLLRRAPRLKCVQNEVNGVTTGVSIAETCRTFRRLLDTGDPRASGKQGVPT